MRHLLVITLPWMLAAADPPPDPPHLILARSLVATIADADNTYVGGPARITWPEPGRRASNASVCSSFLVATLQRAYALPDGLIRERFGERWPEADECCAAIRGGRGFRQRQRLDQVRPGDVIAIDYQSAKRIPTGHVLFVDALPERRADGTFTVNIIDSTGSPHGPEDQRGSDGGAGRGAIRLRCDTTGQINAYAWSPSSNHWHSVTERPVLLAVVTP